MYTIDFETEAIDFGSAVPPKPVGVAIRYPDPNGSTKYIHWGHPDSDPEDWKLADHELTKIWATGKPILCHNAKFDLAVAEAHFGLRWPKKFEDTQVMAYLIDPHSPRLGLKPLAVRYLGIPPDEQDAVHDWVIAEGLTKSRKEAGAFICKVPAEIVAPYAIGDVDRTFALWQYFQGVLEEWGTDFKHRAPGLIRAYPRELAVSKLCHRLKERGVTLDVEGCRAALEEVTRNQREIEELLYARLGRCNLDAGEQVAAALGPFLEEPLPLTPSGKPCTAAWALDRCVADKNLALQIKYRNQADKICGTYLAPWLQFAECNGGMLHPDWNSTKNEAGFGTKTGRLSCSNPNLTNVPNPFETELEGFPRLPDCRYFILPGKGNVWVCADFSGQELRMLAHYAGGPLQELYRENAKADVHQWAADLTGMKRKQAKTLGFSIIYASGARAVAENLGVTIDEAYMLMRKYRDAMGEEIRNSDGDIEQRTGLYDLEAECKGRDLIRTWGGRTIPVEIAKRDMHYKLLNHLIQGSSADQTKAAALKVDTAAPGWLRLVVHDELDLAVREACVDEAKEILENAMTVWPKSGADSFKVPFIIDIKVAERWSEAK